MLTPRSSLTPRLASTLQFDHSFILELRNFTLLYVRKNFSKNQRATTAKEVADMVRQSGISRIGEESGEERNTREKLEFLT